MQSPLPLPLHSAAFVLTDLTPEDAACACVVTMKHVAMMMTTVTIIPAHKKPTFLLTLITSLLDLILIVLERFFSYFTLYAFF